MSKYREALEVALNQEKYLERKGYSVGQVIEAEDLLKQLVSEKEEQESRKDKLVVGSEWVCVVDCYVDDEHGQIPTGMRKGEVVHITKIWLNGIDFSDSQQYPKRTNRSDNEEHFLLCFAPKEVT